MSTRKVTTYYQSDIQVQQRKARKPYVGTYQVEWDPAWLNEPTDRYHSGLGIAGIALAISSYRNQKSNHYAHILQTLESFGLSNVDISSYYHRTEEDPSDFERDVNLVAYAFGTVEVPAPEKGAASAASTTAVMVVIRGTAPTIEWNSNGNVADSVTDGDYSKVEYHEGFRRSELELLEALKRYLKEHDLDNARTKIWVVGHSRGACIANILGADLDRPAETGLAILPENTRTYTYASSPTTFLKDAHDKRYRNILNFIHPEDFIPRVPLTTWGMTRFGTMLYVPSIATNHALYERCNAVFRRHFAQISNADYLSFQGIFPTETFVRQANDLAPSPAAYYTQKHLGFGRFLTFREYFGYFTNECAQHGLDKVKVTLDLLKSSRGPFDVFLDYFLKHQIEKAIIPTVHAAGAYLSRLLTLQELGVPLEDCGNRDVERITLYGPYDLQVRDRTGAVVARILKGACDESLYNVDNAVACAVDEDTNARMVWLPFHDGYTLTYELEKDYDASAVTEPLHATAALQACEGDVVVQERYNEPPLMPGETRTWHHPHPALPPLDPAAANQGMALMEAADKAPRITISVRVEGLGDATGATEVSPGDRACVHAYDGNLSHFEGWSGTASSPHKKLVLTPEESCTLVAHFHRTAKADE